MERSDVVMLACPLTEETYHLISHTEFAKMKPSAYLINVTRGGIIDEPALIEALLAGQLAGAGLDVTEKEPLAPDNPLWHAPNLIITPHRAGVSQHRPRMVFEFFLKTSNATSVAKPPSPSSTNTAGSRECRPEIGDFSLLSNLCPLSFSDPAVNTQNLAYLPSALL
ncbi:MAG: hypothetical protein KF832_23165 [Caldilineaceae bacterium]|nr:hypothetical protein [Caldilineaceae bacterium]